MSIPSSILTTTCDIYRPFDAGAPTTTGVACRLVPDASRGQRLAGTSLAWTHYVDVQDTTDIRDGCTRIPGVNIPQYADGDELRIPDAAGSRYCVVWVEVVNRGTPREFKRVYLVRDTAVWPGP
jgi:hypothetical protein